MNYGIPNDIPSPIIAPQDNKKDLLARGLPLPARPAWLCIDAPEHCRSGISEKDTPDLTAEQIAEAEAEEARRETIKLLKRLADQEEKNRAKAMREIASKQAREEISRARQIARQAKNVPTIGESIYNFRIAHHLNQAELAKLLGCSRPSIGNWEHEKNKPHRAIIEKITELDKAIEYQ